MFPLNKVTGPGQLYFSFKKSCGSLYPMESRKEHQSSFIVNLQAGMVSSKLNMFCSNIQFMFVTTSHLSLTGVQLQVPSAVREYLQMC